MLISLAMLNLKNGGHDSSFSVAMGLYGAAGSVV